MGSSVSLLSLSVEERKRQYPRDAFLPELLAIMDFADETASIDDVVKALALRTDVFLTHNWGINQDNHKVVEKINELLQQKNLMTWFDTQRMEGNILDKMCEGIDNAGCVAVFITETYGEKISGNNENDNCKLEFGYAHRKKKPMIPIVMDRAMKNASQWKGQLGMVLGGLLYIDMTDMSQLEFKIDEIYHAIVAKVGMPLTTLMERQLAMLSNLTSSLPVAIPTENFMISRPSTPVIVGVDIENAHLEQQKRCEEAMISYLNSHDVHVEDSMHYAKILYAAKIASIDKLAKKLGKETRGEGWGKETIAYLMSLGIDEEGADDIVIAIKKSHFSVFPSVMRFDDDENRVDDVNILPSNKGLDDVHDVLVPSDEKSLSLTNTEILSGLVQSPTKTNNLTNVSGHGIGNDTTRSSTHSTNSTDRASFDRSSLKEPLKDLEGKEDKEFKGHIGSIMCLIQLKDGRICSAGGSNDHTIKIWSKTKSGTCDVTFIGHKSGLRCVIELSDSRICSGAEDKTIRIWSLQTRQEVMILNGHTNWVRCICVLRDGKLASGGGSTDKTIRIWDLGNGTCVTELKGHSQGIRSVKQLVDGRIVSASDDKSIKLWSLVSNTCEMTLQGQHTGVIYSVIQLRDENKLVSCSHDKLIKIYNLSSNEWETTLTGHTAEIYCIMELKNGLLCSVSDDKTIKLWDLLTNTCVMTMIGHTGGVRHVMQLNDGRLCTGSHDKTIKLWK